MLPHHKLVELLSNLPGMQDFRNGIVLGYWLLQSQQVPGAVVEFGCWKGISAAFLASLTDKEVWVYDSFEGLPDKSPQDIADPTFVRGHLAVSPDEVLAYFKRFDLTPPRIVKGWFKDITEDQLPPLIAFAHLDGDFYQSILDSLRLVYPRLQSGGACIVHDYDNSELQGVKPAVHEFLGTVKNCWQPSWHGRVSHNQYCIVK